MKLSWLKKTGYGLRKRLLYPLILKYKRESASLIWSYTVHQLYYAKVPLTHINRWLKYNKLPLINSYFVMADGNVELFFTTPDLEKLRGKQGHLVRL